MLTDEDIKNYFASMGITLPDAIIACITSKVNSVYDCLIGNGADECDAKLALLSASGLIGLSMGARRVSNNRVDVLSQSFVYDSLSDLQTILRNNLYLYDKWGCTYSIIPASKSGAFIKSAVGCRR